MFSSDIHTTITTAWWKLLLLTIISAAINYLLAIGLMQIRVQKPTWATPFIQLAEKKNPDEKITTAPQTVSDLFYKWDSYYYVTIAQNGYDRLAFNANKRYNWAFFPLYPTLIKTIGVLPGIPQSSDSYLVIGMIVSNIFFFAGLLIWKKLGNIVEMSNGQWYLFLTFLLLFPLSYVYHMVYTESLFFFLSSLGLYLMAKQKFLPAAWIVGLATVTRITGIFLVPLLLFSYYRTQMKNNWSTREIAWLIGLIIIALTPISLFFNYLAAITGELLAPLKIQAAWNNDGFVPFSSFLGYFKDYGFTFHPDHGLSIILLCLSWITMVYAALKFYQNRTTQNITHFLVLIFSIALVFVNSSVNSRSSIFRYTMTIPYLFVIWGYVFSKGLWRWMVPAILVIFILFHVLFLTFFLWKIPLYAF